LRGPLLFLLFLLRSPMRQHLRLVPLLLHCTNGSYMYLARVRVIRVVLLGSVDIAVMAG
jgi:hypothetical protein